MAIQINQLDLMIQTAIPTVYEKGLSYYEVLNKILQKVNELITETNAYFNVDLTAYVLAKLTEWESDGTIQVLVDQAMQAQIDSVLPKMAELALDVKSYGGATGDGVTNDTAAIQATLDHAATVDKPVYFPEGVYLVTGLTMGGCKTVYGCGALSVIKSVTDGTILTVTDDNSQISKLAFLGVVTLPAQSAISINGVYFTDVADCSFDSIGKAGVYITNTGLSRYGLKDGARIHDCKFYRSTKGIFVDTNGEYVTISNCLFHDQCGWGIWTVGGNTTVTGCSVTKCKNGIYIGSAGNGGHGVITGCTFNHIFTDNGGGSYTTGFGTICQLLDSSERFIGCAFFDCSISLTACTGVEFSNCQFDVYQWFFDGCSGCSIHDSVIGVNYNHADPAQYIVNDSNAHPSMIDWFDNRYVSGSNYSGIGNMRGAQVVGTIPGTQTIATGAAATIDFDAYVNTANYVLSTKYPDHWNAATNKAKNIFGGHHLMINAQIHATIPSGDINSSVAYLWVGTKKYAMSKIVYSATGVYFTINGNFKSFQNEEVYFVLTNNSGQLMTIVAQDGSLMIEGL